MILNTHSPITSDDLGKSETWGDGIALVAPHLVLQVFTNYIEGSQYIYVYRTTSPLGPEGNLSSYDFQGVGTRPVSLPKRLQFSSRNGTVNWKQVNRVVDWCRALKHKTK